MSLFPIIYPRLHIKDINQVLTELNAELSESDKELIRAELHGELDETSSTTYERGVDVAELNSALSALKNKLGESKIEALRKRFLMKLGVKK